MSVCRVIWFCWCHNLEGITKAMREFYTHTCDNSHTGQKIPPRETYSKPKKHLEQQAGTQMYHQSKLWFAQTNTSCTKKNYSVLFRRKHIEIRMEKSSFSGSDWFLFYLDVRIFLTGSSGTLLPSTLWGADQDKHHKETPILGVERKSRRRAPSAFH